MKRIFLNNPFGDPNIIVYVELIRFNASGKRYIGKVIKSNYFYYKIGEIHNDFSKDISKELTEKEICNLYKEMVFE